ncbi:MAG TPA: metallophosphoesterase [Rectinemataceae bacterium]|nr:metallophosphoesterase [Rectinemataceae bacterium]
MRWIVISDLHGDLDALEWALDEAGDVDLALFAGDLTDFGDAVEARRMLAPFFERELALVAVSGNCDRDGVRGVLESAGVSIEGRSSAVRGFRFVGSGGGLRHHGMTPHELTEDELEACILAALNSADEAEGRRAEGAGLVVLSHTPPNGTTLDRRGPAHVGSHSLRMVLGERRPALWVSGHIHEARSLSRLGASLLVNPGSLREGCYAIAEFEDSGEPRVELRTKALRRSHG